MDPAASRVGLLRVRSARADVRSTNERRSPGNSINELTASFSVLYAQTHAVRRWRAVVGALRASRGSWPTQLGVRSKVRAHAHQIMIRKRLGGGLGVIAVLSATCLISALWTAARTPALARLGACQHKGAARVVARTREIVVFREGSRNTGERLYGCLRRGGAAVQLFNGVSPRFTHIVTQVSARGDYAGFVVMSYFTDTSETDVYVVDIATGDWVVDETVDACAALYDTCGVPHLVLGPAGSAAWLVPGAALERHGPGPRRRALPGAVVVSDGLGERTVDRGRGIVRRSLALHGLRLFWRDAGGRRSALLQPAWDGRCMAANSITVLSSRASRVYYAYAGSAVGFYGCWRLSGAVTSMLTGPLLRARYPHGAYGEQSAFDEYYNGLALAGDYGAIANDGWPDSVLSLYDLSTTHLVYSTSVDRLDTLVVGRCGAMAWTQANDALPDTRVRSSVYVYSDGRVSVIDHGLSTSVVDPRAGRDRTDDETLEIVGHTVRWIHDGHHREAPVC